jgi:hypothetical protein
MRDRLPRMSLRSRLATHDHDFVRYSSFTRASRNALAITLTDDSAIAAAPTIGDSKMPNSGYSAPAAIGTPAAL